MAIGTGAGTEIIRSILLEDVANTETTLISGEAHHTYTILCITVCALGIHTGGPTTECWIQGYDSNDGTSDESIYLFKQTFTTVGSTYVFNDRVSFFGAEPSSNTDAARAAQASGTVQTLKIKSTSSTTKLDVTCSYIDQNWS